MARGRRQISSGLRDYVAGVQAAYMGLTKGGVDPKEAAKQVAAMIDKKGDYYKTDLYPNKSVVQQAEDDFNSFRTGTPAINEIAEDMRRFYGLAPKATVESLGVDYSKGIPEKTVKVIPSKSKEPAVKAQLAPKVEVTPEALINITKPQGPKAPPAQGPKRAQQFKDEVVQEIIENNPEVVQQLAVEQMEADLQRSTEKFNKDLSELNSTDKKELNNLLLYAAAIGLGGGGVAAMSSQNNEPQLTEEQLIALKQAGII